MSSDPRPTGLNIEQLIADVPQAIGEVGALSTRQRIFEAEFAADVIGSGADTLWATKKVHKDDIQPDEVYKGIKYGIALLAHRQGGVTFGGLHWCAAEHDECPGLGQWDVPGSANRSTRGAFFTPRSLAEEVTFGALQDLVYFPGPAQTADRTAWRVRSSAEILGLKVGDIAVGSGVFLLAGCRYLADRLVDAWFVEADHPPQDLPANNPMTFAARRLVMRCLYGTDIDATSAELCKLALALLAPTAPLDLSDRIVVGDSLLGITSLDQLDRMSLDPGAPLRPVMDPKLLRLLSQVDAHMREEAAWSSTSSGMGTR